MSSLRFRDRLVRAQNDILREKDFIGAAHARLSFQPGTYRRFKRLPLIAAAIGVPIVAATILYLIWSVSHPKPDIAALLDGRRVATGEWIFAGPEGEKTIRFPDGSDITLSREASVRIQRLSLKGAHLSLEHGGLFARIIHRKETAWIVDIGPFTIEVTGTQFDVNWSPKTRVFSLDLRRGSVMVKGPMLGEGRLMKAGEKILAALSDERIEIEDKDHLKTIIFNGKELETTTAAEGDFGKRETIEHSAGDNLTALSSPKRTPMKWRVLAKAGRYTEALTAAKRAGVPQILKIENATTLMTLGDTARRAGDLTLAATAYKTVRRRFSRTSHSAGAAFALGLIAFDHQRDYRQAAKWFNECSRADTTGTFTREAAGRLIESLGRAGDAAGSEAAARAYLDRFPGGPHARLAKKLLNANE